MSQNMSRIIPIYNSQGEAEAFLVFPHVYNRNGEWIGWATPKREVYSVLGFYVGLLTNDPRIVRNRSGDLEKPNMKPPAFEGRITIPANVPLAPMMKELTHSLIDVLSEEPGRLHTVDSGELRDDMD